VDDIVDVGPGMEPALVKVLDVEKLPRFRRVLIEDVNEAAFAGDLVLPLLAADDGVGLLDALPLEHPREQLEVAATKSSHWENESEKKISWSMKKESCFLISRS